MAMPQLPIEFQLDSEAVARRRSIADLLTRQAMTPKPAGQMVGRHFVANPLAGLETLGQAYVAGNIQDEVSRDQRALGQRYNQGLASALEKYTQTRAGTPAGPAVPAQELPTEDGQNFQFPGQAGAPAVPGDPRAAATQAIASGYGPLQQIGMKDLEEIIKGTLTPKDMLTAPGFLADSRREAAAGGGLQALRREPTFQNINNMLWETGGPDGPKLRLDARENFGPPFMMGGDLFVNERGRAPGENGLPGVPGTGRISKLDNATRIQIGNTTLGKGNDALLGKWAELASKTVDELSAGARASANTLRSLKNIENSNDAGTYQTPFPQFALKLGQLATSMGVRVDAAKLANSETVNSELVTLWTNLMQANGGARGLVKEESEKIEGSLPTLATTPAGRRQIIRVMRMKAEQDIETARDAQQQLARAIQSGDLSQFTYGLIGSQLPGTSTRVGEGVPGLRPPQGGGWQPGQEIAPGFKVLRRVE